MKIERKRQYMNSPPKQALFFDDRLYGVAVYIFQPEYDFVDDVYTHLTFSSVHIER